MNYNKLWKRLIDRGISKTELRLAAGLGTTTLAKLGKNEAVNAETIEKICKYLRVQPGDIMEWNDDE